MRVANETQSELDQFVTRIRKLGATEQDIASVRDSWDDFDDDWTPERRRQFVRMGDRELLAQIQGVHDEYETATTTQDQADALDKRLAEDRAIVEATERMGLSVKALLEWVGDDEIRAWAVYGLEVSPDGAKRSTLTGPLEATAKSYLS